ncbi:ATP-binding protein [Burkholderia pyrrocinia]|uniref:ATP-binding protein n=1 Tax=Burkholderia pyrrocinia TaxID=60550 RepID=UPI001043BD9F|nr:ATP-binding protein [Burkholderia pyrrocinia]TDA47459.1 response regulator [Burkholderia pyrrocinia]
MTRPSQRSLLARFRRYQRLLMYGGAAIITVVALAALAAESLASLRTYLVGEYRDLAFDMRRTTDVNTQAVSYVRNFIMNTELAWQRGETADPELVARFHAAGGLLRIQQSPSALPIWIVGRDGGAVAPADLARYIRLAQQIAPPLAVVASRNNGEMNAYLFSPDHQLLMLPCATPEDEATVTKALARRGALFDTLEGKGNAPLIPPNVPPSMSGDALRPLHWVRPYDSPLTGERAIRVATTLLDGSGEVFGVAASEFTLERANASLPTQRFGGTFMIVTRDGQLVTTAARGKPDRQLIDTVLASGDAAQVGTQPVQHWHNGILTLNAPLANTGWVLVYAQPWRMIAAGVSGAIATSVVATTAIIAVTWILVFFFNRRVFVPMLERSERVFESEHLSRTVIETAPVGLGLIAVRSGEPLLRSPAMAEMAARVVTDVQSLSAALVQRHAQRDANATQAADGVSHDEVTFPTRDGDTLDLAVSYAPARYQGEDVLITAFTDATARKRLERQLRHARQAADAANAAKSRFLAAMSHEIRTPLNAILGNLELLAHSPLDAQQQARLQTIQASSDGLLAIISDVLDFSKIEAGQMPLECVAFDALDVVARALAMFAPVAKAKGIGLYGEFDLGDTLPMTGDPVRLGQVIHNLLSNAIKFTAHGKVTLRAWVERATTDELILSIEDTGIGMSAVQQASLFQAFSQTDASINRRYGGTGLGLALCRRLCEAMGGSVGVDSVEGQGSRFVVRLPDAGGAALDVQSEEAGRFDGDAVLLVTAQDEWRAYAVPHLQRWGLQIAAYREAGEIDRAVLAAARALIVFGSSHAASAPGAHDAAPPCVIVCEATGPMVPLSDGRIIHVSCYALGGLSQALRHGLRGEPLRPPVADPVPEGAMLRQDGRSLRVLVAEDNAVNQRLFTEQLVLLGCDAQIVADGEAALAALNDAKFDVLLTDLGMPGMGGYALAEAVRTRWPTLPVIAVTASVTVEDRQRCEAAGMREMATKPLALAALRSLLAKYTSTSAVAGSVGSSVERDGDASLLGGRPLPDDVRATFIESSHMSLDAIRAARASGDTPQLLGELHSLRGVLNVFRQRELGRQCAQLEQRIKAGDGAPDEAFERFDVALRQLLERI